MRRRFLNAILASLLLPLSCIYAQSPDLKETFLEAESYFLFEEYNEALPLYLRIHRADPDNDNINYKIGVCLLNDPYQKDRSIRYLEQASKNINPKYKENRYKERTAPPEAFFYLGNAYLVNDSIEKAKENYLHFLDILDEKIYDVELVEEQIRICDRARHLKNMPVDYDYHNLGERINTRFADINPIVSGKGDRLVYVSKMQFYDATFFSEKIDGEWQPPRNIIPELGVDGDVYPTTLSWDGNTMIIYRNDDFVGNLYVSSYENGRWTALEKLGDNINTKYWESHGSLSKDGKTLYFTSNRKGGFGGLDIYKSKKQETGVWGTPINLGPTINSRYNEDAPFITENGRILYFSSYGHYNMGGYDVFYSAADENGAWGEPINLGFPINTTDDDLFFYPVNNGDNAYFSKFLDDGYGRHDIYYLDVFSENNPRLYLITGVIDSDTKGVSSGDSLLIYLVDRTTKDTIQIGQPDLVNQTFELKAPQGDYDLLLRSMTFNDLVKQITIDKLTNKEGIRIDDELVLETKPYESKQLTGSDSRIGIEDTLSIARPGSKLRIRLNLEKGSTLFTTHTIDSITIASDTFSISKGRFVYEIIPEEGTNLVDLIMVEENDDKSITQLIIQADKEEEEEEELIDTGYVTTIDTTDHQDIPDDPTDMDKEQQQLQKEADLLVTALSDQINEKPLDVFVDYLLENSPKELRNFIRDLNLQKEEIQNINDLVSYLIKHADQSGFTEEKMKLLLIDLISTFAIEPIPEADPELQKRDFSKGLKITGGLLFTGILVFILLFLRKRKKYQEIE